MSVRSSSTRSTLTARNSGSWWRSGRNTVEGCSASPAKAMASLEATRSRVWTCARARQQGGPSVPGCPQKQGERATRAAPRHGDRCGENATTTWSTAGSAKSAHVAIAPLARAGAGKSLAKWPPYLLLDAPGLWLRNRSTGSRWGSAQGDNQSGLPRPSRCGAPAGPTTRPVPPTENACHPLFAFRIRS